MNEKFWDMKKEKQDRIMNAAIGVFAAQGYAHASTDEIVKRAGISKGLLFHYFISKQGLYDFLYDYFSRFMRLELSGIAARGREGFFERCIAIETARMQAMKQYPFIQCFLTAADDEDAEVIGGSFGELRGQYHEFCESLLVGRESYSARFAEEFTYAISIEEEKAALAAQKELKEREQATEQAAPEVIQNIVFPQTAYTSNEELRKAIIEYAMQYLGHSYVSGGKSLASGTDCSGFTCFIYADFGYGISRTPAGQLSSAGRSIDYSEIQPGDIICYSSKKGKACTHVALYIGDGQIIHAANSRKGVIISRADFEPIVGIKNVID